MKPTDNPHRIHSEPAPVNDLVAVARLNGLTSRIEGDRLVVRGPKKQDSLVRAMLARKGEVIARLVAEEGEYNRGNVNATHSSRPLEDVHASAPTEVHPTPMTIVTKDTLETSSGIPLPAPREAVTGAKLALAVAPALDAILTEVLTYTTHLPERFRAAAATICDDARLIGTIEHARALRKWISEFVTSLDRCASRAKPV